MSKFKVGDVVEYCPSHFYGKRTGEFIGTIVAVNARSIFKDLDGEYYEVFYKYYQRDGTVEEWTDIDHENELIKLTKLEKALK